MSKLKNLSAKDVVEALEEFDFRVIGQKGSHVKIRRISPKGNKQTLTVPNHKEIAKGTLKAIYNQALEYIPEDDLREYFYS